MEKEQVLVIKSDLVQDYIKSDKNYISNEYKDDIYNVILNNNFFIERDHAETDSSYRQIIPYVLIRHKDEIYVVERTNKQTEKRLHNKMSVGIGGHINPVDLNDIGLTDHINDIVESGMLRELYEEMDIYSDYTINFKGIILDNSTEVGKVHMGVVYELMLTTNEVEIKETDKMIGKWININDIPSVFEYLESWSQIVLI